MLGRTPAVEIIGQRSVVTPGLGVKDSGLRFRPRSVNFYIARHLGPQSTGSERITSEERARSGVRIRAVPLS